MAYFSVDNLPYYSSWVYSILYGDVIQERNEIVQSIFRT